MQQSSQNKISQLLGIKIFIAIFFTSCLPGTNFGTNPTRKNNAEETKKGANREQEKPRTPTTPPVIPAPGNLPPNTDQNQQNQPQTAGCYKADPFVCKVERLITEKTNRYRGTRNPLTHDEKLSFVARHWSKSQGYVGSIGHSGFPQARLAIYQQEFNARGRMDAENVAYTGGVRGLAGSDALAESIASEFATMWWESWGHRVNMLGNHTTIGVGVFQSRGGAWYATQLFN